VRSWLVPAALWPLGAIAVLKRRLVYVRAVVTGLARVVKFFYFIFSFITCLQHGESTISAGAGVLHELYITQLDPPSLQMLQELDDLVDKKLFTQVSQRSNVVTLKKMRDVAERSKAYHEEKDNV